VLAAIREVHGGGSPMSSSIARMIVETFKKVPSGTSDIEQLSERELEVLRLLSRGLYYKEIADKLNISFNTVHTLSRRIYEKLQVNSRKEAVERYLHSGQPEAPQAPKPKSR
jgi:DNA-binding NarL/FixJ family response regulator